MIYSKIKLTQFHFRMNSVISYMDNMEFNTAYAVFVIVSTLIESFHKGTWLHKNKSDPFFEREKFYHIPVVAVKTLTEVA